MSDGTVSPDNSTGIPYFYLSPLDTSMIDIASNTATSITISEEMIHSDCSSQKVDPESPLCARLTLTGHMVPVPTASEQAQARAALFSRHPVMSVSQSPLARAALALSLALMARVTLPLSKTHSVALALALALALTLTLALVLTLALALALFSLLLSPDLARRPLFHVL